MMSGSFPPKSSAIVLHIHSCHVAVCSSHEVVSSPGDEWGSTPAHDGNALSDGFLCVDNTVDVLVQRAGSGKT